MNRVFVGSFMLICAFLSACANPEAGSFTANLEIWNIDQVTDEASITCQNFEIAHGKEAGFIILAGRNVDVTTVKTRLSDCQGIPADVVVESFITVRMEGTSQALGCSTSIDNLNMYAGQLSATEEDAVFGTPIDPVIVADGGRIGNDVFYQFGSVEFIEAVDLICQNCTSMRLVDVTIEGKITR